MWSVSWPRLAGVIFLLLFSHYWIIILLLLWVYFCFFYCEILFFYRDPISNFARVCNAILPEYVMRFCPRYPAHFLATIIVFCSMIFCYFSKGLYVVRIPLLLYLWVGISFSQRLHIVVSKLNAIWNKKNSVNYYKTGHVAMMGLLMMTSGYFKSTLISAAGYLPARESTLCK